MNIRLKILEKGWQTAVLFFTLLLIFSNCKNNASKNLSSFDWLIGTWEVNNGAYLEKWEKKSDQYFRGKSFKVDTLKDTLILETIELIVRDKDIFYIPTVPTQNNNQPIEFKLLNKTENDFIFENPDHDFPKKIVYSRIDKTTGNVQISDEKRKIDFTLKKIE